MYRLLRSPAVSFTTALALVTLGLSCTCAPDLGKVEVDPCEGKTRQAATLTIAYDLSRLNDRGTDKKVRVSGNRDAGQSDVCFAPGSTGAISTPDLSGQGTGMQTVPNLQDGNWTISVIVFEGSNTTPHPKRTVSGALPAGATKTLNIGADASGVLEISLN